jgi:transcriptional regulator with XRE-family HTH domain
MSVDFKVEKVLNKIIEKRKEIGLSMENISNDLGISIGAYNKIEKGETKLSLERLYQILEVLKVDISEILEIKVDHVYNQNFKDNSVFHQEIQNLYQDNKELVQNLVDSLKNEIEFLRSQVKN